jgi:hypothetical protein
MLYRELIAVCSEIHSKHKHTVSVEQNFCMLILAMASLNQTKEFNQFKYSRTSNNGHCRGIQILSVIGGVR